MRKLEISTGTKPLIFALAMMIFSTFASAAEYYTWVDENGVTNYSERKPQGYEASFVTPGHRFGTVRRQAESDPVEETPPDETTPVTTETGAEVDPDALVAEEREKYEAELAEERKHNCALGKQNLARLQTYARIRVKGEDGKMRFLTDAEMEQKKQESREAIKFHCRG